MAPIDHKFLLDGPTYLHYKTTGRHLSLVGSMKSGPTRTDKQSHYMRGPESDLTMSW